MKPNILIFNPDQMRRDALGHLGNDAAITPYLDKFASEDAVSFSSAYCQNPVCVPSRCSFLTGLYPHVQGHRTMSHMLHQDESSLFKELLDDGYYVWMNPRNDFLPAQNEGVFDAHTTEIFYGGNVDDAPGPVDPGIRGNLNGKSFYSFYFGELSTDSEGRNYTIDDESVDIAIEKIRNRPKDKPFCVFLGLQLPHPPYQIEEPYFSAVDRTKLPHRILPPNEYEGKPSIIKKIADAQHLQDLSENEWNDIRACYLGMCMKVDEFFGKLCQALKDEGVYDDTAIYVMSDHGDYTGDYGIAEKTQNTFEECLVNVPFMIKPQKGVPVSPGVSDSLVELIDFYATVLDLSGIEPDHSHFGKSLKPIIENRSEKIREFVFSEGGRLKGEKHCSETGDSMPNPYNPYYPRMMVQKDDIAHTKATMIRSENFKYIRRLYEQDEFYDLKKDPHERFNKIDAPEYSSVIAEMQMQMLEWYQETADIVPLEQDERFNYEMIWNRVKRLCPDEMVEEVQADIRNGADLFQLLQRLRQMKFDEE